jgi:hypothetical protein
VEKEEDEDVPAAVEKEEDEDVPADEEFPVAEEDEDVPAADEEEEGSARKTGGGDPIAVPVQVVNVPVSSPRSNARSFDTPGSTQTPDTPKVTREESWKADIRKGPASFARMRNMQHPEREYIFVCRCSLCVSKGIKKALVSMFAKDMYDVYNPKEERATEGNHIAIDRHGFVSYSHPLPTTELARRKRAYIRAHLRETTLLEASHPDFPICARTIGRSVAKKPTTTEKAVVQEPIMETNITDQITKALANIKGLQDMIANTTSDQVRQALQKIVERQLEELSNFK